MKNVELDGSVPLVCHGARRYMCVVTRVVFCQREEMKEDMSAVMRVCEREDMRECVYVCVRQTDRKRVGGECGYESERERI